ncbi:deoxyhypusine synthase [Candidatus Woesearchaeota archaeon]|nr:deoxyhypusine synthase [Candidatus Woesearchaeota archaeon]
MAQDIKKTWDIIFKESSDPKDLPEVKGYDFTAKLDFNRFLESYASTGFQATHLAQGIQILKKMREDNATIFLGYTSNMVSSGLREVIAYLVKEKLIDVLVTTAGGVEEDIIKSLKPFFIGSFDSDDYKLADLGINRIGNIYVPNNCYIEFEKLMNRFLDKMLELQKETSPVPASRFIYELGKEVKDENSIYYWATKNNIPVFCPPLTDGSIGDMMYFFKKKHPEFKLDISDDLVRINDIAINSDKSGVLVLGGSLPKHHVINANIFRDGADYAVYISTGIEGDGSLSGAKPKEAITWNKLKADAKEVQIEGDATIIFPLLVAGGFADG